MFNVYKNAYLMEMNVLKETCCSHTLNIIELHIRNNTNKQTKGTSGMVTLFSFLLLYFGNCTLNVLVNIFVYTVHPPD